MSMNISAFMHLFTRRSYADAKVLNRLQEFGPVSPGSANAIIVAIDGFEVFVHMLIDLSFEILNRVRRSGGKPPFLTLRFTRLNLFRDHL